MSQGLESLAQEAQELLTHTMETEEDPTSTPQAQNPEQDHPSAQQSQDLVATPTAETDQDPTLMQGEVETSTIVTSVGNQSQLQQVKTATAVTPTGHVQLQQEGGIMSTTVTSSGKLQQALNNTSLHLELKRAVVSAESYAARVQQDERKLYLILH